MYKAGDVIVYGSSGVCRVEAVGRPDASRIDPARTYYTLMPVYGTETIYIPTDTTAILRPIITKEEAEQFIEELPGLEAEPQPRPPQSRTEHYHPTIQAHDREALARIIKTTYKKGVEARRNGKHPGQVDERCRKRAEELLYGELAVALEIPREDVLDYIKSKLDSQS